MPFKYSAVWSYKVLSINLIFFHFWHRGYSITDFTAESGSARMVIKLGDNPYGAILLFL